MIRVRTSVHHHQSLFSIFLLKCCDWQLTALAMDAHAHCFLYVRVSLFSVLRHCPVYGLHYATGLFYCLRLSVPSAKGQVPSARSPLVGRTEALDLETWRFGKNPSSHREHPFDIFINPLPTFGAVRAGSLSSVATTSPTYIAARQGLDHGFPETL